MKIIKHGCMTGEHTCSRCGCIFQYNYADIQSGSRCDEYAGDLHNTFWQCVECPECNMAYYLNATVDGQDCTERWNEFSVEGGCHAR